MVSPRVFMKLCSRFRLVVVQGPGRFPTRRTRALRRTLRISRTKAACATWASVSVRMAGCSCRPIASARICRIAKTGHRLVAVGVSAGRSRWGMGSSCCRSSEWNLHVAVQSLVCGQRRRAHRQRQYRAWPGCQVPAAPDTMAVRGSGGWFWGREVGLSGRAAFAGSMELTASRLEWLSRWCGVIRTW